MIARIFISYVRDNMAQTSRIVEVLREHGYEVWYDGSLSGGERWWNRILDEIRRCEIFIYVVSIKSLNSKYCRTEYRYARHLNKPILPVLISPDVTPEKLPEGIGDIQAVAASVLDTTAVTSIINSLESLKAAVERREYPAPSFEPSRPRHPQSRSRSLLLPIAALFIILVLAILIYRNFQQETEDPGEKDNQPTLSIILSTDRVGVITSPLNGNTVQSPLRVEGVYSSSLMDDKYLWLFVQAPNGLLYPQAINVCEERRESIPLSPFDNSWHMEIGVGTEQDTGKKFFIVLGLADKDADTVIHKTFDRWCEDSVFSGMTSEQIFEDLNIEVQSFVEVTRK